MKRYWLLVSRAGTCLAGTTSFWMIPKLSSIVILNLIANLPFLYHNPKNTR